MLAFEYQYYYKDLIESLFYIKIGFLLCLVMYAISYFTERRHSNKVNIKMPLMFTVVPVVLFSLSFYFIILASDENQSLLMLSVSMYSVVIFSVLPVFMICKYISNRKLFDYKQKKEK